MTKYIFSQLVLNWYHKNGRKDLPWQINKTLYTVWISEIMLQQTTVKSAIPYFKKFILNFPNIKSLNDSKLDDVLYLWSGLGYYNRAKNIYKSAQIIKKKYKGIFPDQFSNIIQLPGIGRSTAGAILSLSLNFFYPILDGNVKRILVRYYGISGLLKDKKIEKKLWNIIESITPIHNTGKFNQGMMDIGASICISIKPKCTICPLKKECIAQIEKKWEKYPLKNIKKTLPQKISWFIIIKHENNFWLKKNTEQEIWKELFCFPKFKNKEEALIWLKEKKININTCENMISFFHKFSHFILHINPILIRLPYISGFFKENHKKIWYNLKNPQHIGLPRPVQKILENFKKNIF
ncbi:A/G-specific adenine glycosylase [Buchnera aphidicola]|uniref:Adenine DNA glycosylase n=1 Tax=Buchnera aphidicola subsp. Acyrthosiphon pisum (strain 5A) TaxID=563178 RepID=A0A7U4DIK8_BUCA5|nr:A/G-specific adenine glycosylase [Buchnera aphidicola]ACL30895.1 A/G-specific adenine glycosylase [Buchnera aphidicola str. 5A (Acyrthosiphon pisum)]